MLKKHNKCVTVSKKSVENSTLQKKNQQQVGPHIKKSKVFVCAGVFVCVCVQMFINNL